MNIVKNIFSHFPFSLSHLYSILSEIMGGPSAWIFTYALVVPFFLTNFLTWWVIFANLPNPRSNMWLRLNCFYSFIVDSKIKRLFSTLRQKIATGNRYRSLKIATKKQTRHLRVCLYEFFLEKMSDRKRLGLSLEKDGGYSKLIVFMSAVLSGFTFGLPGFLGALTVEVRGTTRTGCGKFGKTSLKYFTSGNMKTVSICHIKKQIFIKFGLKDFSMLVQWLSQAGFLIDVGLISDWPQNGMSSSHWWLR